MLDLNLNDRRFEYQPYHFGTGDIISVRPIPPSYTYYGETKHMLFPLRYYATIRIKEGRTVSRLFSATAVNDMASETIEMVMYPHEFAGDQPIVNVAM